MERRPDRARHRARRLEDGLQVLIVCARDFEERAFHSWSRPAGPGKAIRGYVRFLRGSETLMFITKTHISRRRVLRGMGATVALPFLDAMIPARTAFAKT